MVDGVETTRRRLLIGLAVGATVLASELYVPKRGALRLNDKQFDALIPRTIGPWQYLTASGLILPPQDQLSETLYEQLLTRVYVDEAERPPVMVAMAYSSVQEGRLQVHRPEVCYPAAGFTIATNELITIDAGHGLEIPARFLVADRGSRRECVLYWTRIGPSIPTRWSQQRWIMASANLQGYVPDGLLARVSIISADVVAARGLLEQFVRSMLSTTGAAGQRLLVGRRFDSQRWV